LSAESNIPVYIQPTISNTDIDAIKSQTNGQYNDWSGFGMSTNNFIGPVYAGFDGMVFSLT